MTLADGGFVHILVPSEGQLCPTQALPATLDGKSFGDLTSGAWNSTGDSPETVVAATDRNDRSLEIRTTIP